LVAPTDAVVDTGKRQLVWVADSPGRFVAREVKVGAQSDDGFEILQGLREGETIAASGGFLLDASSQLNRGGGAHAGHGTKSAPQASPSDAGGGHTGH
jgi:Cu(I)/Ag(I) efflux system membrane fusion protein